MSLVCSPRRGSADANPHSSLCVCIAAWWGGVGRGASPLLYWTAALLPLSYRKTWSYPRALPPLPYCMPRGIDPRKTVHVRARVVNRREVA